MQNQRLRTTLTETQKQVEDLAGGVEALRQAAVQHSNILRAVISLLGEESVKAEIERLELAEQQRREAQAAEQVRSMVERGVLVPVEATTAKSFVVGTDIYTPPEGQPGRPPARMQFEVAQVKEEVRANYIGKKVGDAIEAPGGKFVVAEVYDIDITKAVAEQTAPTPTPQS